MGIFSKKAGPAAPVETHGPADTAGYDTAAAPINNDAINPFEAPQDSGRMTYDNSAPTSPTGTAHSHSIGDTLYTAREATVSGVSVFFLILWTIAVAGWTGFQVVQNALVWARLGDQPFPQPAKLGYSGVNRLELRALWAIVAIEAALVVFFLALAIALMWVPCIGSCRQHKRARRHKREFLPWFITLILVASAWFKLFTLSSVLNKMSYQKSWCATGEDLDIKYTFDQTGAPAPPAGCQPAPMVTGIRRTMVYAMLTVAFHLLVYFAHQPRGTFGKLFGFIPAVVTVALLVLKPLTSMMNWFYTQQFFINGPNGARQGNFTFTAELIVALIEFITAVWLSLYMGWAVHSLRLIPRFTNTLLGCCGKQYDDVYYEHETTASAATRTEAKIAAMEQGEAAQPAHSAKRARKSYHLRAAAKSVIQQYYYMTQLPSVFGFVSPMITNFALGVRNWWIIFDIIVGAALIFIYMVLCVFHRALLAPARA